MLDIEELATWGRQQHVCPYYTARAQADSAELVLLPYNYITDPTLRGGQQDTVLNLRDAVVIFDEAHNIAVSRHSCGIAAA